jgi:FMN reductase
MSRTLTAVSAGLGSPSASRLLAGRLTQATERALASRHESVRSSIVDLRDHARDITNALLTGVPSSSLAMAIDTVTGADGLIAVTPVFNASYSGLFKMFFDILEPDSLTGKPVLAAAAGNSPRHSLIIEHALKPMFGYLHTMVVPTGVYAASQDWGTGEDALPARIDRAGAELATLIAGSPVAAPADPYANVTSFEDLLGR